MRVLALALTYWQQGDRERTSRMDSGAQKTSSGEDPSLEVLCAHCCRGALATTTMGVQHFQGSNPVQ
jgi:hypothetical protein